MRRKAKRDLGLIVFVLLVIAVIAFANYNFQRGDLAKRMDALRRTVEAAQISKGITLMQWSLFRATKGSMRSGPTFSDEMLQYDGQPINIVGFMQPLERFRDMTEFILLPLPIECYFCQIPPMRDVLFVKMREGEKTNVFEDPVRMAGTLVLHKEPGSKFFYSLEDTLLGEGDDTQHQIRKMNPEHMAPKHENTNALQPGFDPPTGN